MPSDLLTALLGVLSGGLQGYESTSKNLSAAKAAKEEADKEREFRRGAQNTDIQARKEEGAANRQLESQRLSQDKDVALLKLQAERDALDAQLKEKRNEFLTANATDRAKLQADIDQFQALLSQKDRELSLQAKNLDIEQAYKLGTGKLGTGKPGVGGAGGGKETVLQDFMKEIIKSQVSAAASAGLAPDYKSTSAFMKGLLSDPVVGAAFGLGTAAAPPAPTAAAPTQGPGLKAAAAANIDDPINYGMNAIGEFAKSLLPEPPLISNPTYIESIQKAKKKKPSVTLK